MSSHQKLFCTRAKLCKRASAKPLDQGSQTQLAPWAT